MTIEYESLDELKEKLAELGYYIIRKPEPIGKLKKCKVCGRTQTQLDIRIHRDYTQAYIVATTAKLKCPKCGNTAAISTDEYITDKDIKRKVADSWNNMN